jgi:hypothetical protein
MTAGAPTPRVLLRSEDSDGEISVIETAPRAGSRPAATPEMTTIGPLIAKPPPS